MKLRAIVNAIEEHPIFMHDLSFENFPEFRGWKLRPEIHDYLLMRRVEYTIRGGWIERNYCLEIHGLHEDDVVYLMMKYPEGRCFLLDEPNPQLHDGT